MEKFNNYQLEKGFSEATIRTHKNTVLLFKKWCKSEGKTIEKLSYNDLLEYVQYCQMHDNITKTIRLKMRSLSHYFEFLELENNPATLIKLQGQTRQIPHNLFDQEELKEIYELQHSKGLVGKRNKVLLSLVIFQGVASMELEKIELKDVDLMEGKIYIPSTRTSNSRTLELKPFQLLLLQDYMVNIRKEILNLYQRESDKLLVSMSFTTKERLSNITSVIVKTIKSHYPKLKNIQQLRQSVITSWVQQHGLRQAQYMSGHKYVSSTERYSIDKMEGLKAEIEQHFPSTMKEKEIK